MKNFDYEYKVIKLYNKIKKEIKKWFDGEECWLVMYDDVEKEKNEKIRSLNRRIKDKESEEYKKELNKIEKDFYEECDLYVALIKMCC